MPNKAKVKATRVENELANILWNMGYAVVRGPSSGSGTRKRFQPDLIAVKDKVILVFEVKIHSGGNEPIYIPKRQVDGLKEFASRAGAQVYVAVRIRGGGWRFHKLSTLPETRGGGVRVDNPATGIKLLELDELLFKKSKRITEFMEAGRT